MEESGRRKQKQTELTLDLLICLMAVNPGAAYEEKTKPLTYHKQLLNQTNYALNSIIVITTTAASPRTLIITLLLLSSLDIFRLWGNLRAAFPASEFSTRVARRLQEERLVKCASHVFSLLKSAFQSLDHWTWMEKFWHSDWLRLFSAVDAFWTSFPHIIHGNPRFLERRHTKRSV